MCLIDFKKENVYKINIQNNYTLFREYKEKRWKNYISVIKCK